MVVQAAAHVLLGHGEHQDCLPYGATVQDGRVLAPGGTQSVRAPTAWYMAEQWRYEASAGADMLEHP